eukprot:1674484-Amphidinium_carterae.1
MTTTVVKRCRLCSNVSELAMFISRIAGQIEDEAASGLELEEICHMSDSSLQREPSQMVIDSSGASSGAPPTAADTGEHYSPEDLHQIVMTLEDRVHTLEGEVTQLTAS